MTQEQKNQFESFKTKWPDAILLFRVGDFYETYEDDAIAASEVLGITLMQESGLNQHEAWLPKQAGFPAHALDTYLPKLVRAGKRVCICDQLGAPSNNKATNHIK